MAVTLGDCTTTECSVWERIVAGYPARVTFTILLPKPSIHPVIFTDAQPANGTDEGVTDIINPEL